MRIDWKNISIRDLGSLVCEKMKEEGMDAVMVGGACVSIYTKNRYVSYDLDFVSHASLKEISRVLSGIGFSRKSTRHFVRKGCPFFIKFVAPPLSIGSEPVKKRSTLKSRLGELVLLTPTDSLKDRLAAFYHWNDLEALEQAIMLAKAQKVNLREVRRWSEHEGHIEKFSDFSILLNK